MVSWTVGRWETLGEVFSIVGCKIEVLPGSRLPILKFVDHLAEMRPSIPPDPLWRLYLVPCHMVISMAMMFIVMVLTHVAMGIVIAEDRPVSKPFNASVIAVVYGPNLVSLADFQSLVDIKKQAVLASNSAPNPKHVGADEFVLEAVFDDEPIA